MKPDKMHNQYSSIFEERCILGTAGLGGVWGKIDEDESVGTILKSLELGCRAFDTSPSYGDAERILGRALGQWKGAMPRISTKAGRLKSFAANEGRYDYSDEGLERSLENSLKTLNIPFVDILFLHEPANLDAGNVERVIGKFMEFKRLGLAKKIGVGGNFPEWFAPYVRRDVFDIVMCFNRLNVCCIDDIGSTLPFCVDQGIEFYCASPLFMGLLGARFDDYIASRPVWVDPVYLERAQEVKKIADQFGMSLSVVAHRFLLNLPYAFKVVIGASGAGQLLETYHAMQQGPLSDEVYKQIVQLLQKGK